MTALTTAFKKVDAATSARDLFNGDKAKAQKVYRDLAKALHPDAVPSGKVAAANAAFAKLSRLWSDYESGDADRTFASITIATRKRAYVVGNKMAEGDIAGLYRAEYREDDETKTAIMKMARNPANNDLLENEAKVLRTFSDKMDPVGLPFVSQLLDSFKYRDEVGADRQVNVLTPLDGFYTLAEVRDAFPGGLDIRDALWMWKRLLIAIGHAHRAGVVHGAVVPEHVLIHPEQHGLCLVDWSYAKVAKPSQVAIPVYHITSGMPVTIDDEDNVEFEPLSAIVPSRKDFYPADVFAKKPVTSKTDVVMASKTIATLFNAATPPRFVRFAKACWMSPEEDAWLLMNELTELAADHFPRAYRPFSMPV